MPDAPQYRLVRASRGPSRAPVLDPAQQRVVDHDRGPLLVLAGPGTGKTTTLVEAAVERVRRGVDVANLLLLTFGRRAAGELRDRFTARLASAGLAETVREPVARTFHSYSFGVLRMSAVAHGLPAPRLLSAAEQDVMLRELIEGDIAAGTSPWPAALGPALRTRAFAGELRDLLLRAVERGLDGPGLAALGRARGRPDWEAAGVFLSQYQDVTALARPGAYDPAELIRAAVHELRADRKLLADERARRRRIFVDEYQDTDPAQAELLALLAEGADEVVIVGDPDQSIYAFRGTDPAAMRDAADRFGITDTVALTTSRRSGRALLEASRRVAERLPGPVEHRRLAAAPNLPPGTVEVRLLRSSGEEAGFIASTLRRAHLEDEIPWSRMAVLVRSTASSLPILRRALVTAGVPVAVRGEDLPLAEQPAVSHLVTALRCALRPEELTEEIAEHLLLGPIGRSDALHLRRLRRALRELAAAAGDPSTASLAAAVLDVKGAAVLPDHVRTPVQRVTRVIDAGRQAIEAGASAEEVLWAIWAATDLARRWALQSQATTSAGAAADRDLDAVVDLFDAAARFTDRLPRAGAVAFLEHLTAQQVPSEMFTPRVTQADAVTILTAHASKGLEWDLVCVAGVQEGTWPDVRRRGSLLGSELLVDVLAGRDAPGVSTVAPQLAEERRLFYVAVTRARRRLVVTAVAADDEQPSRFLDELDPVAEERPVHLPGRGADLPGLVSQLRAAVTDPDADRALRVEAAGQLARLAGAGVAGAHPDDWWGLAPLSTTAPVANPAEPVRVGPSRVEAFLRCEVQALLVQLGAKDGDALSASLGTLVHEVAAAAPAEASLEELEAALDERWESLDFGARWLAANERRRASGILARLVAWLRASRGELTLVAIEEDFKIQVGDALLAGQVDRLERDAHGRLVVVDLKTGKSKVPKAELAAHAQLGTYQVAVEAGAFGHGSESGGARLVQLAATGDPEQRQEPLAEADDPQWARSLIDTVASRLRGSTFTATVNSYCGNCDLKGCCPVQVEGRQVTS